MQSGTKLVTNFSTYLLKVTLILTVSFSTYAAYSICPENLKYIRTSFLPQNAGSLYSVCSEAEYLESMLGLSQNNVFIPLRDLVARRLIHKRDLTPWLQSGRTDVWNVYKPTPTVWTDWVAVARNINSRDFQSADIISIDWINNLYAQLSKNNAYADAYTRAQGIYGNAAQFSGAITAAQKSSLDTNRFLKFVSTKCWEYRTPYEQANVFVNGQLIAYTGAQTITPNGRYCGYIMYPDITTAQFLLIDLVNEINYSWRQIQQGAANIDPILLAARAQKMFVTIHPFSDFNGRTSRLIMDRILTSLGLPAPILDDFDEDLTSSDSAWAGEVGKGIAATLHGLRSCVAYPSTPACQRLY